MSEIKTYPTDWSIVNFDASLKSSIFNFGEDGFEYINDEIRAFETEGVLVLTSDEMAYDAVVNAESNRQLGLFKGSGKVHHFVEYKLQPQEIFDFYHSFCTGKDKRVLSDLLLTREWKNDGDKFQTLILCDTPERLQDFGCLLDLYKDSQYQRGDASAVILQRTCIDGKKIGDHFAEYLGYEIANATGAHISPIAKVKHKIEDAIDTIHDCLER